MDAAKADELIQALGANHQRADLGDADRAMLDYAVKLTLHPGQMNRGDAATLRAHGFDDRALHDLCAVVAYYAFVNRIADGLGVELEATPGE